MQSRVVAKLALPRKKAASRSPKAADGRNHALAAVASDIAGKFAPSIFFPLFPLNYL
jgi:hypothetical protein